MNREATDLAGVRYLRFDTLGSTNAEALTRARAGERGPLWIVAAEQTAGRGRRGAAWVSKSGNLYATLLLTEPSPKAAAPQLSFVTALALHDAVADLAPQFGPGLKLKWPNDLLLGGAKLAGILIEGESDPAFAVAVGIGVNCAHHPEETAYPATDLANAGALVSPQALLGALADAMARRLKQWSQGQGFAAIRADWLKRAAGLGQDIHVRLPEREFSGRFEGLDEAGRLLVSEGDKVTAVGAGEVFGMGETR
ncbi:MAG TPA: biotin--[acetyl-CoA-carboxylase] ligase [Pseudolabrys sp.]|jgi:BirA family biotin operon repressor/biotin-[acetyl-CoA-carboxylase] ligase|nr:biotin--[acetyl-CoA-carboxylase] ligase [Pseudolabrys sp.]